MVILGVILNVLFYLFYCSHFDHNIGTKLFHFRRIFDFVICPFHGLCII